MLCYFFSTNPLPPHNMISECKKCIKLKGPPLPMTLVMDLPASRTAPYKQQYWDSVVELNIYIRISKNSTDYSITGGFSPHFLFRGFLLPTRSQIKHNILRGLFTITNYYIAVHWHCLLTLPHLDPEDLHTSLQHRNGACEHRRQWRYIYALFASHPWLSSFFLVYCPLAISLASCPARVIQLDVFTLQRPVQCVLCAAPWIVWSTGRQPPPLSSVLYGIIYKRCSVVAAQVLLREKSGA
jgi:hypothetical protein